MHLAHLFELVIATFLVIIVLYWAAHRVGLPAPVALIVGGATLAFVPGLPSISVDPELVIIMFLPPLLFDSAWAVAMGSAQATHHRHRVARGRRCGVHHGGRGADAALALP